MTRDTKGPRSVRSKREGERERERQRGTEREREREREREESCQIFCPETVEYMLGS